MLRVQEIEVEVSCAKSDAVEIKVGKIDVGWGWYDWKDCFFTKRQSTTGVDGVRQNYIIYKIKTQGWVAERDVKTDEEKLIYLVTLHVPAHDTYNRAVWHEIQNCYIGTTA